MTHEIHPAPGRLRELIRRQDWNTLKTEQDRWTVPQIITALQVLPPDQQVVLFRLLEKDRAIEVFEFLDTAEQTDLMRAMTDPDAVRLLEELDPDLRTHIFDELPAKVAKRLLAALSPDAREAVNILFGYPEGSAGRIMNPRYLAVRDHLTAQDALAAIRGSDLDKDELGAIFVIDEQRFYQGSVSLAALVKAAPEAGLSALIEDRDVHVSANEDRLRAARMLKQYDLVALPVVDSERRLVGAVAFDDVIDVLEEEASETMYQKAGIVDVRRERDIIHSQKLTHGPIRYAVGLRIVFLLITVAGGLVTGGLIGQFEEVLAAVLPAAVFIPLVMDMGGNVGTQSTTTFARGLALGHIDLGRFWRHTLREVNVGAAMGAILGLVTGAIAYFWQGAPNGIPQLGIAVGVSVFSVVTLATLLGFVLPWALLRFGFDHAPGADPFITTIKDFVGLGLYFSLVSALLGV